MAEEKKSNLKASAEKKTKEKVLTDSQPQDSSKIVSKKKDSVKKTVKAKSEKNDSVKKSEVKVVKSKNMDVSKSKKKKNDYQFSISGKRYSESVGKRKTSIARVRLFDQGSGRVEINGKDIRDYFFDILISNALLPLDLLGKKKDFDFTVLVEGGGVSSQSDAVRHGIARALIEFNPDNRLILKRAGLLTRDARIKERKKPGLKRARRAPQWKKR